MECDNYLIPPPIHENRYNDDESHISYQMVSTDVIN
jgi:hypothetical protein